MSDKSTMQKKHCLADNSSYYYCLYILAIALFLESEYIYKCFNLSVTSLTASDNGAVYSIH